MRVSAAPSSLWVTTLRQLFHNKLAVAALLVIILYTAVALLTHWGILARHWEAEVGGAYAAPSMQHWLGTDLFGRSVLAKIMKSTEVAMSVGFVVGLISITIGVILGALAGWAVVYSRSRRSKGLI